MNEEELLTIHKGILNGLVVYVDVWLDSFYNHSDVWEEKLVDMGAKGKLSVKTTVFHLFNETHSCKEVELTRHAHGVEGRPARVLETGRNAKVQNCKRTLG